MNAPLFFSLPMLANYALNNGPTPELPIAYSEDEIRGRTFFEDDGLCGECHGGPMLNETTSSNFRATPGSRFDNVLVSEFNNADNPLQEFVFTKANGQTESFTTPDPGRALTTGLSSDVNDFKIGTLWGINKTAPYFHDNSAATLEDVVDHYVRFFATFGRTISEDDQRAILAYMRLL
jgi:cytochrome c peroxidase